MSAQAMMDVLSTALRGLFIVFTTASTTFSLPPDQRRELNRVRIIKISEIEIRRERANGNSQDRVEERGVVDCEAARVVERLAGPDPVLGVQVRDQPGGLGLGAGRRRQLLRRDVLHGLLRRRRRGPGRRVLVVSLLLLLAAAPGRGSLDGGGGDAHLSDLLGPLLDGRGHRVVERAEGHGSLSLVALARWSRTRRGMLLWEWRSRMGGGGGD